MSAKIAYKYRIQAPAAGTYSFPADFTLQGSNNGTSWTTLDTQTSEVDPGTGLWTDYYQFVNTTAYRYYKLNVTAGTSTADAVDIQDLDLIEGCYITLDLGV